MITARVAPAFILAVTLCACGGARGAGGVTYHDDVSPFLDRQCRRCHGVERAAHAPSLSTYADVVRMAPAIANALRSGRMPKRVLARDADCLELDGPAPPTSSEIALFDAWIGGGMREGVATESGQVAGETELPVDGQRVVGLSEPYVPQGSTLEPEDDHRCFLVDVDEPAGQSLLGFRVMASELVHHLMLFTLPSEASVAAARALDARTEGPGWPCFGAPGVAQAQLAGVWTPGQRSVTFPAGAGIALPRRQMILQLHYRLHDSARLADQTRIALRLGQASSSLSFVPFAHASFVIPPGQRVTETHTGSLATTEPATLLGVFPHMHKLGRALRLTRGQGSGAQCLVNVPLWDYGWQELGMYRRPQTLDAAAELTIECSWDSTGRSEATRWGERASDEMCMTFLLLAR